MYAGEMIRELQDICDLTDSTMLSILIDSLDEALTPDVGGKILASLRRRADAAIGLNDDDDEFDDDGDEDECEGEDEDEEPDGPGDDDLITEDYVTFYRFGCGHEGPVIRVPLGGPWQPSVRDYMDQDQFWPNVWSLSDHGNLCLLSLEDDE